ncbi:CAP domain-containing protein [Planomonospora algeriensis]
MCLGSLAALSTPAVAAHAAAGPGDMCGVSVSAPYVTPAGKIEASAARAGCENTSLVRLRIKRAQPGPDRVIKSGSQRGIVNGQLNVTLNCSKAVRTYYAEVVDYRGNQARSLPIRLSCSLPGFPSPTATAVPSATPTTPAPPSSSPTAKPTTPAPPSSSPANPGTPGAVGTAEENEVVRLTNIERAKGGCAPLTHDPQLRQSSYGHSADMAAKGYFDHVSQDGRTFMQRIRGAGFTGGRAFAENIAWGYPNPAAVVNGWMNSSGHKANIMNCGYNLIGVGAAKNAQGQIYWTQNFATR